MTREQEKILENNPNFTIDFLYYCDTQEHTRFNCKKKKETRKEYQHRYYMEVTKKKRQQKRVKSYE